MADVEAAALGRRQLTVKCLRSKPLKNLLWKVRTFKAQHKDGEEEDTPTPHTPHSVSDLICWQTWNLIVFLRLC